MKKNLIITVAILSFGIFSCKKNCTTIVPIIKTPEELLIAKTWKADELRIQQNNSVFGYYNRGGSSNTANYDSDSLKFNTNNTGVYYSNGLQTTTTWNFINSEKTKMTLIINYTAPLTLAVENISLSEFFFNFSEYHVNDGISFVVYGRRTPN